MKNPFIEDARSHLLSDASRSNAAALAGIAEEMRTANMIALLDSPKVSYNRPAIDSLVKAIMDRLDITVVR